MTALERFMAKIAPQIGGCWFWIGATNDKGYGTFWYDGHGIKAHRWAYEYWIGPIPDGLEIDHLCRTRACVNPDHLEAVSHMMNIRRGNGGQNMANKTHCPAGHAYAGDNLHTHPTTGRRTCRTCRRATWLRWRWGNAANGSSRYAE